MPKSLALETHPLTFESLNKDLESKDQVICFECGSQKGEIKDCFPCRVVLCENCVKTTHGCPPDSGTQFFD